MHRGGPLVLIVACCAACSGPKPVPADCALVVRSGLLPPGPLFPSAPGKVTAGFQFVGCDSKQQVTATVAVVGPDDQAIASTFTTEVGPSNFRLVSELAEGTFDAGSPADGLTAWVHLTFTPPQPGLYHLTVRVDPGLGTLQADVNVLVDRRSAEFQTLPMPFECDDFDLQLGVGLCLVAGTLYAVVDGGQVDSIPASAFAADGANVWLLVPGNNSNDLTFASMTPSGSLTTLASGTVSGAGSVGDATLRSSGQRVALVAPLSSQYVMFEASLDGGVVVFGEFTLLGIELGQVALQWAPGAGAIFSGRQTFANGTHDQVCEFSLLDGGLRCVTGTGFNDPGPTTVGSEGAALWTQDRSGTFTAWSALADGGFITSSVSFGSQLSFLPFGAGGNSSGPVFRDVAPAGVELPSVAAPYLLQAYGLPPLLPNTPVRWGSSSRLYWEWHADNGGTLVYFTR